jgi:hypothetical protein
VTPRVELVAGVVPDDGGVDDAEALGFRVADDGGDVTLLEEDEFESVFRFVSFGADLPQSDLPLEAAFCDS